MGLCPKELTAEMLAVLEAVTRGTKEVANWQVDQGFLACEALPFSELCF